MNDKVEELVERVRLTDDEIFKIDQDFHKALRESGCFLEPRTVYRPDIKVYVEAQLNKVLNDPDLALIDRGRKLPLMRCVPIPDKTTEPYKTITVDVPRHWDAVSLESYLTNTTQEDMLQEGYLPVIPLARELEKS